MGKKGLQAVPDLTPSLGLEADLSLCKGFKFLSSPPHPPGPDACLWGGNLHLPHFFFLAKACFSSRDPRESHLKIRLALVSGLLVPRAASEASNQKILVFQGMWSTYQIMSRPPALALQTPALLSPSASLPARLLLAPHQLLMGAWDKGLERLQPGVQMGWGRGRGVPARKGGCGSGRKGRPEPDYRDHTCQARKCHFTADAIRTINGSQA